MSRPRTFRSKSSDKALPSLPAGGLGLDFSGLPRGPAPGSTVGLGLGLELNPKSSKPPPTHFIPLRQSPTTIYTSNIPLISSPSIISSSPSTPIASSSVSISGYPFPYGNEHYLNSTSTVINRSTSTTTLNQLTRPPDSPSVSISTAPPDISTSFTPKKKKVGFGQAGSIRSENVMLSSSTSSTSTSASGQKQDVPLGRKRSSGQLLMGIGKGLNRVGSVMRRNTDSNVHDISPSKKGSGSGGSTWRKGRRRKTNDWQDGWEKVDRIGEESNEGDVGIGRPFNVGHDLHVSPDLSDLPEQWLSSLKAQGLTESDLILISAARKKQHEAHRLPLRTTSRLPQAPLSAPPSRLLDAPHREMIASPSSEDSHQMGSSGLLKKFSFEDRSPTTPTQAGISCKNVAGSSQMTSSPTEISDQIQPKFLQTTPDKHDRRRAIESFPVSAAGSSDLNHNHDLEVENVFNPHRTSTISALPGERTDFTVPTRRNKRFSSQLKGFRESTFGLGEKDDGEWGKSVLDSTWLSSSSSAKEKGKMRDDKIPIPPGPLLPSSSSQSQIISGESGYTTPPRHDSIEEVVMPKSPPPPARPRKQPSVTLNPIPSQENSQLLKEDEGSEVEIETRKSSESFGVHYNTSMAKSKSSVSVGSEVITPSTSMEQGMTVRERGQGDSDYGHEHEHEGPGVCTFGSINEKKNTDICDQPTELISREGLIRRYHSNPHLSLPASAGHSRSTTPDLIPKLKPNLVHQQSYSTFDSTPYKVLEEDDLMDGLDRANPEERASIALSILSSRTSASMQSLHELSQATVRTAYKLPPVGEVSPITTISTSNPFINTITTKKITNNNGDENGNENENDKNNNYENNDNDNQSHTNRKSSGGLKLIDESSECGSISLVSTSMWGSEENEGEGEGEAKDAMDALGEAARRLRSS